MFPAYPLLCFNAAVALYLMRGWLEVAFVKVTNSPYRVSYLSVPALITLQPQASQSLPLHELHILGRRHVSISVSRILALWYYYHAPLALAFDFQYNEIPRLLKATGLLPNYPENMREEDIPPIDLSPVKQFDLKLCLGNDKWSLLKASLMGCCPDILRRRKREHQWMKQMTLTLWT